MLLHRPFSTLGLHEAHHGVVTIRVEGLVITSLCPYKLISSIGQWVFTQFWFHIIPKVGHESLSIVKLNSHGLIIDGGPGALNRLSINLSSCLIAWVESYSCHFLICELELVVFVDDLDMVWLLMGAHFVGFKKIDVGNILRNMEVPGTVDLVLDTVHRLIGLYVP